LRMSKNRVIVEAVLAGQSHGSVARQYGILKRPRFCAAPIRVAALG
jgi:hypothetical protein